MFMVMTTPYRTPLLAFYRAHRYAMRYIAMRLRLLLHSKFPEAQEDEILKVVGNLVYYRYMNPAIVAPDAFDIIDVGVDQQLNPDQVGVACLGGNGCCCCELLVACRGGIWAPSRRCSSMRLLGRR